MGRKDARKCSICNSEAGWRVVDVPLKLTEMSTSRAIRRDVVDLGIPCNTSGLISCLGISFVTVKLEVPCLKVQRFTKERRLKRTRKAATDAGI